MSLGRTDCEDKPDLIVLDVMLPDLDGSRAALDSIPAIAPDRCVCDGSRRCRLD